MDQPAIHTWRLDEPPDVVAPLLELLSEDERQRAAAYTLDEPRRRFIVGRARLRERLSECLGVAPDAVGFAYGPKGKPELVGGVGPQFNLAHSADLAVLAVSDAPVGVDVEAIRPRKSAHDLAERWFHPSECDRVAAAADPLAEFYRTWVMKEAVLKLVGLGVGEALPKLLTPDASEGGVATGLPNNPLGTSECVVRPIDVAGGFAAAIATATPR